MRNRHIAGAGLWLASVALALGATAATVRGGDGDVEELRTQVKALKDDLEREQAARLELQKIVAKLEELLTSRGDASEALLKRTEKLEETQRQLTVKLMEATAENEALRQKLRVSMEKVAQLEQQNADLQAKLAGPKEGQPKDPPKKPSQINGRVTAVRNDLASVDVGRAAGVVQGMKLFIHRGSKFVAVLRVTVVEENASAGSLEMVQGGVKLGDAVSSLLEEPKAPEAPKKKQSEKDTGGR